MHSEIFEFKWLVACAAIDLILIDHLHYQGRWWTVARVGLLAHLALFLFLL